MTERTIILDPHVGRVDSLVLAQCDTACTCPIWLTDWERYVLQSFLLPYAEWRTRLVIPLGNDMYQTVSDEDFAAYRLLLDDLTVKLTGGDAMGCNDNLANALNSIADALRATVGGGGGGGCGSGSSSILNCLSGYTQDQVMDTPATGVDPGGNVPPEGFNTMQEYLAYKCQVANAIVDDVKHFFQTLQGLNGAAAAMTVVTPVVIAALIGTGAILFPPADVAALFVVCMTVLVTSSLGFSISEGIANSIEAERTAIVCALYKASNTVEALDAVTSALDDILQAIEWTSIFGAVIGPELAIQFGAIAAAIEKNGLVNSLFKLTLNFVYPAADCSGCTSGSAIEWHFDTDLEGWTWVDNSQGASYTEAGWAEADDPGDTSPGAAHAHMVKSGSDQCQGYWDWIYTTPILTSNWFHVDFKTVEAAASISTYVIYTDDTYAHDVMTPSLNTWQTMNLPVNAAKEVKEIAIYVTNVGATTHTFMDKALFFAT